MKDLFAIIMAGGEGTRFYPLSTSDHPKQFLNFILDGISPGSSVYFVHSFSALP